MQNGGDTPALALAAESISAVRADGSWQEAGAFGWAAPVGTMPFAKQLHLQPDEAGKVFRQVVDARLKARGVAKGADADAITVVNTKSPRGIDGLLVTAHHTDGTPPAPVWIPMSDFRAQQVKNMTPERHSGGIAEIRARGFDPNRPDTVPKNWRTYPVKYPKLLR